MSLDHFEERSDSWRLRIEGWTVSRHSLEPEHEIDVVPPPGSSEADTRFEIAGGEVVGSAGNLVGSTVREAIIWKDGRLDVQFDDASLHAAPDLKVEAWQIVGPDGLLVVAPIGEGEPSTWFGGGDDPRFEISL